MNIKRTHVFLSSPATLDNPEAIEEVSTDSISRFIASVLPCATLRPAFLAKFAAAEALRGVGKLRPTTSSVADCSVPALRFGSPVVSLNYQQIKFEYT